MVKISFASIFFLLATLSSLSFTFPIQPRAVGELEEDLNQLSVDVAKLASLVGSIVNGLDVVAETVAFLQAQPVELDLIKCNDDTSSISSFSVDEAKDVIEIVKGIVPNVEAALSGIVEKQEYIDEFIVPGPVLYLYLEVLDGSTTALANSIIELIPSDDCDLVKEATSIKDRLQVAFSAAVDAYALVL
ncbi:hypothetical protein F5887DRAFT_951500 [Amanita rubescens]|nr:hypothetical protein F5887DRAFT_951500 [Amanita rubescens]